LQEQFGDDEDAPTNAKILIQAYQKLAEACRKVGETEEAAKYDDRIKLLKERSDSDG